MDHISELRAGWGDWTDPNWADKVSLEAVQSFEPVKAPVARRKQLWVSKATRRRCTVLWATTTQVCVRYSDDHIRAQRTFDTAAFECLYSPVK